MGQRGPKSTASQSSKPKKTWKGKTPPWRKKGLSRAERVIRFIECLPITSGKLAGQQMTVYPWQRGIIEALYRVDENGRRIVRTAIITLPRKNGKTQLASALLFAHLGIGPEAEQRGQCFSAANDRNQASLVFNELEAWVHAVPEFTGLFNIKRHEKRIECIKTGSVYQPLSRDSRKAHGLSPSLCIYDEAAQAPDSQLWDNLTSGTGARHEPLSMIISTQAPDDQHFLSQLIDYGRQVKNGELPPDDTFYLADYSAADDADPWEPETWYACNPALDVFRDYKELSQFADKAKKIPSMESVFKNLYLNLRCSADPRFVSLEDWRACSGEAETVGPCYMGLDLASVQDLTCLAAYWPETGACKVWTWLPGSPPLHERAQQDRVPYDLWEREGFIETFPGRVTDYKAVAIKLMELQQKHNVAVVCFDRWRIHQLTTILDEMGAEIPMEPIGQGYKDMSPCLSETEKVVINHQLRHGDNPVLTWCMSNVRVLTDPANNRKFDKGAARFKRIDAAQALAMAVGIASRMAKPEELDFENTLLAV